MEDRKEPERAGRSVRSVRAEGAERAETERIGTVVARRCEIQTSKQTKGNRRANIKEYFSQGISKSS